MQPRKPERDSTALDPESSRAGSTEGPSRMSYNTKDELIASETAPIVVPDGGAKAWLTVAGAWFVLFATFGYLYSYGVYQDFYTREYLTNHSPSSIAWIGSFQIMMPFLVGIVSGKLFDSGKFHFVEILGGLIFVFSVFMLSLAKPDQYYQIFLSQAVGMGLGLGLTFVPTVSINVHHFKKRRGLAAGIGLSGSSVGATVFPIMINHLLPKIGFANTVRATGYIILGCLVVGNSMMRTRLPPRTKQPPSIATFFDVGYTFAVIGALISTLGFYFPVIYLQLFAVQHSVDSNLAFYSIAILNGSSAFGRVIGNHLADLYGPYNIQVPCGLLTGGVILGVLGVHNAATLSIISILYGMLSGAWLSLAFSVLAALARSDDEVGARIGLALALSSFGSLGSAPIQGALLTDKFVWTRPIIFSGAAMFVGGACFWVTRTMQAKRLGTQKV